MGVVYLAEDPVLQRQIAIKVLPDHVRGDPAWLARFRREARLLAAFYHPNIATIHSMEEHAGRTYLTMEFVDGRTLRDLIDHGEIGVPDALRIAHRIASALHAAHQRGIVHRDLKPGNVMVTAEGEVKVLDFGLAKALVGGVRESSAGEDHGTSVGMTLGTPGYMSPEQARGQAIDGRADIWALGCTLFECLAGKPAFGGTTEQKIEASLQRDPPWVLLPKKTPRKIRKLLEQCLRKSAEERLAAVAIVGEQLAAWAS